MSADHSNQIEKKCETFLSLSPANLYLSEDKKITPFLRMFVPSIMDEILHKELKKQTRSLARLPQEAPDRPSVLLWIDQFRLGYVSICLSDTIEHPLFVTFGPVAVERLASESIRYIGYKMKLSGDECLLLETFFDTIPSLDIHALQQAGEVLFAFFSSQNPNYSLHTVDHTADKPENEPPEDATLEHRSFVAENYATESRLLSAVEHGDIDFIRTQFSPKIQPINLPTRYPGNPLRDRKNLAITGNSILLRAAIKGGLKSEIAHNMSHSFAIRIEQQTNMESLTELLQEITLSYAEAVRKYALRCSELVNTAVILVHRNITAHIALSDIAGELHVSREHLCRQFHQEMGTTLTEYIHNAKIQESLPLLASRKFDVGRIAFLFGFSSPAHYTKVFAQIQGVSPRSWQRAQQQQKNIPETPARSE